MASFGDHVRSQRKTAFGFTLEKMQLCLLVELGPYEIVASQCHFSAVLVPEATDGDAKSDFLFNQFGCEYLAQIS